MPVIANPTFTPPAEKKDLMKFLRSRHPYWEANHKMWELYGAIKRREIDEPNVLVRGVFESETEFKKRIELSAFIPESSNIVERVMGFIARQDCERDLKGQEAALKPFIEKANKRGHDLRRVTQSALGFALYQSAAYLLIDAKRLAMPEKIDSVLKLEQALGEPYAVHYTPEQAVNWDIAEDGSLNWILLREEVQRQDPFSNRENLIVYRFFERNFSWVFKLSPKKDATAPVNEEQKENQPITIDEKKEDTFEIVTYGPLGHHVGMVPLVQVIPFQGDFEVPMQGVSFIKTAALLDIQAFRVESDFHWSMFLHLHPQLVIKTATAKSVQAITTNSAIILNPDENEDVFYVTPPSVVFDQARQTIREARENAWIQTGQDAASRITEGRITEQSGIHKRLSFEMAEAPILNHLSDVFAKAQADCLEIAARYKNPSANPGPETKVFTGAVTHRKNYDSIWVNDFIATLKEALPLIQHSPTAASKAILRAARALLDNPDDETIQRIKDELEGAKEYLDGGVEVLITWLERLKLLGYPSPEFMKQLFADVARKLVNDDEQKAILEEILTEIEEGTEESLAQPDAFDRQIENEETDGSAGQE